VQFRTHRAPTISRRETMTFMRDDRHVERTQRSDEMGTIPTAMSLIARDGNYRRTITA